MMQASKTICRRAAKAAGSSRLLSTKIVAPPMVFVSGEEMTRYTMELILDKWVKPNFDLSKWDYYDLSCVSRDNTEDKVLHDAVAAGARIGSIFKVRAEWAPNQKN